MIDIVIINWNAGMLLNNCVNSIRDNNNWDLVSNVFIVDNNSTDGSVESIPPHKKITIVRNKKNEGFAKACNQGFKICTSKFVLLLNPDTILLAETLSGCVQLMNTQTDIDILGCRLLDEEGKTAASCSRFPSPARIFFDATGLSKLAPTIFKPASIMTDWSHSESRIVDQVMGAFMFMQKNIFEKLGYFDERFFVYYEEVDFCKRNALAGGKVYFEKEVAAVHIGGGTTQTVKAFRLFLNLQSRLSYAKKHFTVAGYFFVVGSTFLIEPFTRILFNLFKRDVKSIKEVLQGYAYFFGKKQAASYK